jgi:glycosyltransferase involved in cell wall biosynthesis
LNALVSQDFPKNEFEVIVVNNDPEDSINFPYYYFDQLNLRVVKEANQGSYAARNKGISLAIGKIIALTDSDCIPDRNWLKNSKKYFEKDKNKELGILAGDVPLFYKNPNKLSNAEVYEKYTGFTFESYVKEGNCGAGNWFSYPEIIKEFGGFNSQLKSNGDTELSGRISKKYKVVFAPDVIVTHPARFYVRNIVYKYRRLLGGVFLRRYQNKPFLFLGHILNFNYRRLRFSTKKFLTVPPKESWAIFMVSMAINIGAWREYFSLIRGGETKR